MDETSKKAKWEVIALAKQLYAMEYSYISEGSELSLQKESYMKIKAIDALRAAEIFFEEVAKAEGAV